MIAIGSDHGGFSLKQAVLKYLEENGIEFEDYGTFDENSCDYPDMAAAPCAAVISGKADKALLFCGTGMGVSIAANKYCGIRAAVCSDTFSSRYSRLHNNANVLCLGGRVVGAGLGIELVDVFLNTEFEGGRHQVRVDKISSIEKSRG